MSNGGPQSAQILQAQGMVSVQAKCSLERALLMMRTAADATGTTLDEVAVEVLAHRKTFY